MGGMSALQASRKYGVPSRTLYDKVKKMGITTGRQVQRKSLPNYPSQFPGLSGVNMMNMDMEDREDTNDSSLGTPDEQRATMVPPTSLSTYMLNIMKGIQPDRSAGDQPNSDISLTPMNLSTMLSSHSKRQRERSLSPVAHQRDLDDDIVDSTDSHRSNPGEQRHGGNNGRHSPASPEDIKSRYLDDLRRRASSGSNIPTSKEAAADIASSTTHSPPTSAPATPTDDNNLPPRKRKVSQEHVDRSAQHSDQPNNRSPYNGIRETQQQSQQDSDKDEPIDCR